MKIRNLNRKLWAAVLVVLAIVMATAVVYALSPTIEDGDDTGDWGSNPTTCSIGSPGCSRILDDPQDVIDQSDNLVPEYDVDNVYLTNDSTYMYFRVDMYGDGDSNRNTWLATGDGSTPELHICLDIDNNDATGSTVNSGICDGNEAMPGADYRVSVKPDLVATGEPSTPELFECTTNFCTSSVSGADTAIGYDSHTIGDSDAITEIRVALSDLGITGATCPDGGPQPCALEIGLYYDNGTEPQDDSIPNMGFGSGEFGFGSPTAVSLQSLNANSASPFSPAILIAGLVLAVLGGGAFIYRRQGV